MDNRQVRAPHAMSATAPCLLGKTTPLAIHLRHVIRRCQNVRIHRRPATSTSMTNSQRSPRKRVGGGNYRESVVDLLKLLDVDSSLETRSQLARLLNVR